MPQYPTAIPNLANPTGTEPMSGANLHSLQHGNANDEIEAIATELGTNPKGTFASVKARLDSLPPATQNLTPTWSAISTAGSTPSSYLRVTAVGLKTRIVAFRYDCTSSSAFGRVYFPNMPNPNMPNGAGGHFPYCCMARLNSAATTNFGMVWSPSESLWFLGDAVGLGQVSSSLAAGDYVIGTMMYDVP